MTSLAFWPHSGPPGYSPAPREAERKHRLAIVSSEAKFCGIAAYTASLKHQLADAYDVTVFPLDQYLLRSRHRQVRKLANQHIKEICAALRNFDAVNLQLEHGTLGRDAPEIYRRLRWLVRAAPRLSVTFHTLLSPQSLDVYSVAKAALAMRLNRVRKLLDEHRRHTLLCDQIAKLLRQAQRTKPVSAIVHNRRDLKTAYYLYGLKHVFDHPLAFLPAAAAADFRAAASRGDLAVCNQLPADAVLIGVFGFLNRYKGFGTAIEALRYLPPNHHLLIFGGVHPNEIAAESVRHPYISSLYEDAYIDTTLYDRLADSNRAAPGLVLSADGCLEELMGTHPRDLSGRIHFMGALDDADFLRGMAACDMAVFPYLEVGQSASGPISQALELGCRIIASRTHAFLAFADYHPGAIEFFDIGNHIELAGRILARPRSKEPRPFPELNTETNKATYLIANGRLAGNRGGASQIPLYSPAAREPATVT